MAINTSPPFVPNANSVNPVTQKFAAPRAVPAQSVSTVPNPANWFNLDPNPNAPVLRVQASHALAGSSIDAHSNHVLEHLGG